LRSTKKQPKPSCEAGAASRRAKPLQSTIRSKEVEYVASREIAVDQGTNETGRHRQNN